MPVENSRLKGFFKLSVKERREKVAELAGLDQEAIDALAATGELSESAADRIIENVIGTLALPVGVATNFIIDDELSKENNDPWDTQGLWLRNLGSFGFDNGSSLGYFSEANEIVGVRWSGHTHTKFGIRGRDKIAK